MYRIQMASRLTQPDQTIKETWRVVSGRGRGFKVHFVGARAECEAWIAAEIPAMEAQDTGGKSP